MTKMTIRIVTPNEMIYEGSARRVRARGTDGYFTVLPSHAPMIASLAEGELQIEDTNQKIFYVVIDSGVLEVTDNLVNILPSEAVMAEESELAAVKMKFEKRQRKESNAKSRTEMLKMELELQKLLRQGKE